VSDLDRRFYETFAMVLGALIVFSIFIYFLANYISGQTQEQWSKEERATAATALDRTKPVGSVNIAGETPPATATAATEPAAQPAPAPAEAAATTAGVAPAAGGTPSGEDIYNGTCFACHATGAAGAPKIGDKADWGPRIAKGTDTLVQHAINGFQGEKGIMPPKGGRADFSDDAVAAAVKYMVSKAQ
jgi:cytochrome c5